MDKEDVIADLALRRLANEERLKAIINNTLASYLPSVGIIRLLGAICGMLALGYLVYADALPAWPLFVFVLPLCLFIESRRQKERIDALVELIEMNNDNKAANKTMEPTGHTRAGDFD
jgi:integral membrane sensor domain MASE1